MIPSAIDRPTNSAMRCTVRLRESRTIGRNSRTFNRRAISRYALASSVGDRPRSSDEAIFDEIGVAGDAGSV